MILQVSGRTDICALYPKWFINRLKEGYVLVRNPYNKQQVSHINISKDVVDCIAFCTKNPQKIIPYLKMIDELGYKYYFMIKKVSTFSISSHKSLNCRYILIL
ncbi:DUF1848 family protein [Thomasclavelia cocleata]|uniref:DUF1848 family protein n=1 Tax=Thomasclavelia cocleata TaxID=69824 RepID=UPI00255B2856|nr:DUF1848 family protein [Thomasclavelia cocleata]